MMIVVLLMSSCLFLFVSYQLYLRLLVEKLDSEDRTLKRKINFYKYQKNSRLMIYLYILSIKSTKYPHGTTDRAFGTGPSYSR